MDQPRPGPYAQYNYIDNVNTASTANTWQTLSYVGPGSKTANAEGCGCSACPGMTCNLAKAGARTGALSPDTQYPGNMAYNPLLESCQGASGSCLSMNGDSCCVGTSSYEYKPTAGACSELCTNYWSGISKDRPLSALWSNIQVELPVVDLSPASVADEAMSSASLADDAAEEAMSSASLVEEAGE